MNAGTLEIELIAGIARLQADMDRATRVVGGAMNSISGAVQFAMKAFGALAAGLSVAAFAGMIKGSIDAAASLHDMSIQTGASVASLMELRSVAATSDTSIEGIATAMNKLAKGMAVANEDSKGIGQAIKSLGLDFNTLQAMAPENQMIAVAKALSKIDDGGKRAAIAMTLFKGDGAKMLPFLADLAEKSDEVTAKLTKQEIAMRKGQAAMADEFGDNLAKIKEVSEGWKRELANGMLPVLVDVSGQFLSAANTAGGFTETLKRLSADGTIERWARMAVAAVKELIAVLVPAVKIAAAYFAIFVAAPAIISAATAMFVLLYGAIGAVTVNMIAGSGAGSIFNTMLFGTSVSAGLAAGSLTALKLAGSVLFAAFAGWQIGSYLSDNFVEARVAGLAFVGSMLKGWEHIRYGAEMAWEGIKFAWDTTVNALKSAFAAYLSLVAKGFDAVGASKAATQINEYAESLRASSKAQKTFAQQTAGLTDAHDKSVAAIDTEIVSMVAYELAASEAAKAAKTLDAATSGTGGKPPKTGPTDEQKKAYQAALKSANDFIAALRREGEEIGLNADQVKMLAAAREAEKAPRAEQRMEIMKLALANVINRQATEEAAAAAKVLAEAQKSTDNDISDIMSKTSALDFQARTYGMLPAAITAVQIAELEASKQSLVLTDAGILDIQRRIDALTGLAAAQAGMTGAEAAKKAGEDLDKFLDPAKAQTFGEALKTAFGVAGDAMSKLVGSLQAYGIKQAAIDTARKNASATFAKGSKELAAANIKISDEEKQARLGAYGDMAAAAKGFFKEGSKGYEVMEGAEKAFRAMELANMLKSMVTSLFVSSAKASGAVAGQAVETSAVAAGEAARNATKIPGVFMSFMSALGPWGMAAAGVAIAAVMGGAFGGGGSAPTSAKERQRTAGTGSVFGDADAKSESIANSLKIMERNSGLGLVHSNGMLKSLRNIEASMTGLTNLAIRSGINGVAPPDVLGSAASGMSQWGSVLLGKVIGKVWNGVFGGNVTTLDTGVTAGKLSLAAINAGGLAAQQYTETKKDGGLFGSDKYRDKRTDLSPELNRQFSLVVSSLGDGITAAADMLGFGGAEFNAKLASFVVDFGKISLKGLSSEQIQEQFAAVFSKIGDDMAKFAIGGLEKFQVVGEGYFETLAKVANNLMQVKDVFAVLDKSFTLTGMAAIEASEQLIAAAGDLDKLTEGTRFYVENFLSEAERLAPIQASVVKQMALLGYAGVDTREEFKTLVKSLNLTTASGAEAYAALMEIAPAFAEVFAAIVDPAERVADARDVLSEAYDREYDAILAMQERMASWAVSLRQLHDSTLLGSLSTLTPQQKYAEARAQYERTLIAARGGDEAAQGNYASAYTAFLTASQMVNASGAAYQVDFSWVQAATLEAAAWAEAQVDVGTASLAALDQQVLGLIALRSSVEAAGLSVTQAIAALTLAMTGTTTPTPGNTGIVPPNIGVPPGPDIGPLVAELQAVRAELAALRAEQAAQNGELIQSNIISNQNVADQVVTATLDGARTIARVGADREVVQ
jgi:hypothetical protein